MKTIELPICHFIIIIALWVSCWACKNKTKTDSSLSIATQDYAVLAEKTISYQADFDIESWNNMLADNVEFTLPNDSSKYIGKAAATYAWQQWWQKNKITALHCSQFSQIPINSKKAMRFSKLSGIYVFSLFNAKVIYNNGNSSTMKMNYFLHFNNAKMIDKYYAFHDKIILN